jgi:hypothetical protein
MCNTFCLRNDKWLPSDLVHSPIMTDNYTYSFDASRHMIRVVYRVPCLRSRKHALSTKANMSTQA